MASEIRQVSLSEYEIRRHRRVSSLLKSVLVRRFGSWQKPKGWKRRRGEVGVVWASVEVYIRPSLCGSGGERGPPGASLQTGDGRAAVRCKEARQANRPPQGRQGVPKKAGQACDKGGRALRRGVLEAGVPLTRACLAWSRMEPDCAALLFPFPGSVVDGLEGACG